MSVARVLPLLLMLASIGCGSSSDHSTATPQPPKRTPAAAPARSSAVAIPAGSGHLAAMSGPRGLTLRDRPGGKVIAHLRPQTDWGSSTVVWATERRGHWLGGHVAPPHHH